MSESAHQENGKRRWIHPRIITMLAGMLAIICALVIVTDLLSTRDRHPAPATSPASSAKGTA